MKSNTGSIIMKVNSKEKVGQVPGLVTATVFLSTLNLPGWCYADYNSIGFRCNSGVRGQPLKYVFGSCSHFGFHSLWGQCEENQHKNNSYDIYIFRRNLNCCILIKKLATYLPKQIIFRYFIYDSAIIFTRDASF